jgi:hypothetical protein
LDLLLVSFIILIKEKRIKTKGSNQINKGLLKVKKCFWSRYLPKNNNPTKATAHWDAKPANFDH